MDEHRQIEASEVRPPMIDRRAVIEGSRDILPVVVAVTPLAIVIGVAARHSGIDAGAAWAASFVLCAGTAQLTVIELLHAGVAPLTIVATATLINSRFVLYSATLARWFAEEPLRRRLLLALPLVDQLFAVCERRFRTVSTPAHRRSYYLGAAVTLVVAWSATQAAALSFASSLPDVRLLRLAAPLVFVGLLARTVNDRAHVAAAAVAATIAILAAGLPQHLNLACGILAGLAAGRAVTERVR
jgi:predicted branched-subunit amino acid permease